VCVCAGCEDFSRGWNRVRGPTPPWLGVVDGQATPANLQFDHECAVPEVKTCRKALRPEEERDDDKRGGEAISPGSKGQGY